MRDGGQAQTTDNTKDRNRDSQLWSLEDMVGIAEAGDYWL